MYYQLPGVRVKPKLKFENSNDYPIKKLPIFKSTNLYGSLSCDYVSKLLRNEAAQTQNPSFWSPTKCV